MGSSGGDGEDEGQWSDDAYQWGLHGGLAGRNYPITPPDMLAVLVRDGDHFLAYRGSRNALWGVPVHVLSAAEAKHCEGRGAGGDLRIPAWSALCENTGDLFSGNVSGVCLAATAVTDWGEDTVAVQLATGHWVMVFVFDCSGIMAKTQTLISTRPNLQWQCEGSPRSSSCLTACVLAVHAEVFFVAAALPHPDEIRVYMPDEQDLGFLHEGEEVSLQEIYDRDALRAVMSAPLEFLREVSVMRTTDSRDITCLIQSVCVRLHTRAHHPQTRDGAKHSNMEVAEHLMRIGNATVTCKKTTTVITTIHLYCCY